MLGAVNCERYLVALEEVRPSMFSCIGKTNMKMAGAVRFVLSVLAKEVNVKRKLIEFRNEQPINHCWPTPSSLPVESEYRCHFF